MSGDSDGKVKISHTHIYAGCPISSSNFTENAAVTELSVGNVECGMLILLLYTHAVVPRRTHRACP